MNVFRAWLGESNYQKLKGLIVRFWFLFVVIVYYLRPHWILGNFILLYMGFKAGRFWDTYKGLVVAQGEVWKREWGLNKDGAHKDDSSRTKGYA